jgi:hypothetical protein
MNGDHIAKAYSKADTFEATKYEIFKLGYRAAVETLQNCDNCANLDLHKYGSGCRCEQICVHGDGSELNNWEMKKNGA